jgi:hypothetical protein
MNYDDAPYIRLHVLEQVERIAARQGVSDVARSPRGFVAAYKLASGDPYGMGRDTFSGQMWEERRSNFIKRHVEQARRRKEAFWTKTGQPTRRHLALMMWAFTPTPRKTLNWLGR